MVVKTEDIPSTITRRDLRENVAKFSIAKMSSIENCIEKMSSEGNTFLVKNGVNRAFANDK